MSGDDGLWSVAKTMDIKFDLREYVMNALNQLINNGENHVYPPTENPRRVTDRGAPQTTARSKESKSLMTAPVGDQRAPEWSGLLIPF